MESSSQQLLILGNMDMVRFVARQLHSHAPHVELDDLISEGTLGLIAAAKSWDPAGPASFRTFAQFRIKGAILDSLRKEYRYQPGDDEQEDGSPADPATMTDARMLVESLPPREKQVVLQKYWEGQRQRSIAKVMSITPVRVSQLHKQAISRMRSHAGLAAAA